MSEHTTKKDRGWLLPDSTKSQIGSGLHLVSTPIGNLGDITFRALDVLDCADLVLCEDTRVTKKLLNYFGLKGKKCWAYNDHNGEKQIPNVLEELGKGLVVALVSDAGTPLISDPGYKLVRACVEAGIPVTSVPGANAPLTALQLSGFPSDHFCFLGFLPAKTKARQDVLKQWGEVAGTLVAFETGSRILKALDDIDTVYGTRKVAVVREMTKLYEEMRQGTAKDLLAYYNAQGAPKGEIVLVFEPPQTIGVTEALVEEVLREALKKMKTKEAAAHVSRLTGRPKKEIYDLALKMNEE